MPVLEIGCTMFTLSIITDRPQVNSVNPDQMPQNVASDLGLHGLHFIHLIIKLTCSKFRTNTYMVSS